MFLPSLVLPEMPLWAAITVFSPMTTLWATWIRLSSLTPFLIRVSPSVARSMVVQAPISTSSSRTTIPICGIFSIRAVRLRGEAESVAADHGPGLDDAAVADDAPFAHGDIRIQQTDRPRSARRRRARCRAPRCSGRRSRRARRSPHGHRRAHRHRDAPRLR